MAEIKNYGVACHVRGAATDHLLQTRRGRVRRSGAGQAFWFGPTTSVLSEVPVDDRELTVLFHGRTLDYQDVSVQATVGFRFADPDLAARRVDFGLDLRSGRWRGRPLDQVAQLLTELAQQHGTGLLAGMHLVETMAAGLATVRDRIAGGLATDERLAGTGIAVNDVRVVAVRPEPDVERALQTPARELIQAEADRATFERRARAVEQERAIGENELQSRIELAAREENLVAQQGRNAQRLATEQAAAERIRATSEAEREGLKARSRAEARRVLGAAEAQAEQARMAVYQAVDPRVLLALAAREAAAHLPQVGSLTLSPDVVSAALARLADGTAERS